MAFFNFHRRDLGHRDRQRARLQQGRSRLQDPSAQQLLPAGPSASRPFMRDCTGFLLKPKYLPGLSRAQTC